jgi:hypothetical protein
MNSHNYLVAAAQTLADPSIVGAAICITYVLVAGCTVSVKGNVSAVDGFKMLTPPLGAWLFLPVAIVLFPILACVSVFLSFHLLRQLLDRHSLNSAEWTQLLVFFASLPLYIFCPISLFRWCFVRRRYNGTRFEWGLLRVNHAIEWSDVTSFRADDLRGLELRLHNGTRVKIPAHLNGVAELAQAASNWIAVDRA